MKVSRWSHFRYSLSRVNLFLWVGFGVASLIFFGLHHFKEAIPITLGWGLVEYLNQIALAFVGGFIFWFVVEHYSRSVELLEHESRFDYFIGNVLLQYVQFLCYNFHGIRYFRRDQIPLEGAFIIIGDYFLSRVVDREVKKLVLSEEIADNVELSKHLTRLRSEAMKKVSVQIGGSVGLMFNNLRSASLFIDDLVPARRFLLDSLNTRRQFWNRDLDPTREFASLREQFEFLAHMHHFVSRHYKLRLANGEHVPKRIQAALILTTALLHCEKELDSPSEEVFLLPYRLSQIKD